MTLLIEEYVFEKIWTSSINYKYIVTINFHEKRELKLIPTLKATVYL